MWAYRQPGPTLFTRVEVPAPDAVPDRHVAVRFVAGGICGSDLPPFFGVHSVEFPQTGSIGAPLHEISGTVVASATSGIEVGDRVVGTAWPCALQEVVIAEGWRVRPIPAALDPVGSIVIQPLATVLCGADRLDHREPGTAVVLGLGPMGLLWAHVLAHRGWRVLGVDRVDRRPVASRFGLSETVQAEVAEWAAPVAELPEDDPRRPGLVVDAIGHNQDNVGWAVKAAHESGQVYAFGLPEEHYVLPMRLFFRKKLTLRAGDTDHWPERLRAAEEYAMAHPELLDGYVTDRYPVAQVRDAFLRYAQPSRDRLKVVLVA
ncbi:MAG: alcohol dehydrogenase catalytic domain-containing protein [Pseudoclavibacter sp.]